MTPEHLIWLAPIVFIVTLTATIAPKLRVAHLMRPRIITTRPLAAIADQENDAYLNGEGFTGNAIADARIRLFDAIANTEKPTEDAIDHAISILSKKSATVGECATAVKYLQTGDKDVPVRPGESWLQYMQRREREEAAKAHRTETHERIASRIAAENRANYGQELTEDAARAYMRRGLGRFADIGADTLIGHLMNAHAADVAEQAARMVMMPPPVFGPASSSPAMTVPASTFDLDTPVFTPITAQQRGYEFALRAGRTAGH
ncbi:hypothetical protein [Rhodococcoides fascians]|uniref:hypothetical protein n=1 Tax=Rhodococcoides fascians TaxID=1828 RepID=UPI00055E8AA5|nr:hypothetical protein [Rhodococcus fascians]